MTNNEAQRALEDLKKEVERLAEAGLSYATVLAIIDKFAVVTTGNGMTYATNLNGLRAGDQVLVHPQTQQIVQKTTTPLLGDIHTVDRVTDLGVRINVKGEVRLVASNLKNLKRGDKVLLDPTHNVVVYLVEKAKEGKPIRMTPVHWDDIGGHTEAKQLLREAVELPYKHPKTYQHYGKRQPKGILLHGKPGCGKTLLGKAVATAIGTDGFLSIKGPEVLNMYVGESEAKIRMLFKQAQDFKAETGKPAVIFIDEAESLLSERSGKHNYMGQTVVPTFLTEMDGIEDSSALVILSTNRPDMLDAAIIREGRIDYKIEVKRPDEVEAKAIFGIHMRQAPIDKTISREKLIDYATGRLYEPTKGRAVPHSGALIAGTVDKAVTHAIRRDIASGKLSGLIEADFEWATNQIITQEGVSA